MPRWITPVDPECPEVEHFFESLDADPMTAYSGCGDEIRGLRAPPHGQVRALPGVRGGERGGRVVASEGPPPTVHDHEPREIVSWLQKAIRRSDTEAALYAALELSHSGYGHWLWARLRVICSEDVGHAWPEGPSVIEALYRTWRDFREKRKDDAHLIVAHAAIVLSEAPKSRLACWAAVAWSAQERREVPDEALDRHTLRGRKMGRGWDHFWSDASLLERHEPHPLEDQYRALARVAVERPSPPKRPPKRPPDAPSLFE